MPIVPPSDTSKLKLPVPVSKLPSSVKSLEVIERLALLVLIALALVRLKSPAPELSLSASMLKLPSVSKLSFTWIFPLAFKLRVSSP